MLEQASKMNILSIIQEDFIICRNSYCPCVSYIMLKTILLLNIYNIYIQKLYTSLETEHAALRVWCQEREQNRFFPNSLSQSRNMKYEHEWTFYRHLTEFMSFIQSLLTSTSLISPIAHPCHHPACSCLIMDSPHGKLSCQTSSCWGSKSTEGKFSINTQEFGKKTSRLTARLTVCLHVWQWVLCSVQIGKRLTCNWFLKGILPRSAIVLCCLKELREPEQ